MAFENQAAWLTAKGSKLSVGAADFFRPGPQEVLIKNRAWAINPIDWKMQEFGFLIDAYPTILGNDIAGDVVEIGSEVSEVQVLNSSNGHLRAIKTH
jgi:NADPH:quinone reductase-like Zn-dependent oxidoreductase